MRAPTAFTHDCSRPLACCRCGAASPARFVACLGTVAPWRATHLAWGAGREPLIQEFNRVWVEAR